MEEKKDIIKPADFCELLKKFCEKKGLEVHEGKFGVSYKMAGGAEVFIYSVPKKVVEPNPPTLLYGLIYRDGKHVEYLTKDAARMLYGKLKEVVEQ